MLSNLQSVAFYGIKTFLVDVEVDVRKSEKFSLLIVGLPDTAVRESKDRVLTAIKNSDFEIGDILCTVNLAPGDLKKEGALYDLPIALALMRAIVSKGSKKLEDYLCMGELSLSGDVRPIKGALSLALKAKELGKRGVILPKANVREASVVEGIHIIGVDHLKDAYQYLLHPHLAPEIEPVTDLFDESDSTFDFADIKGQLHVKRALEIAAAGNHNILLSGPPGCGKTMMGKALISIMPKLTLDEALECTKIHSIAGLLQDGQSLLKGRPFRAPHHTVSYAGLIGGGSIPKPGEVCLAHNGVLFLDELPEFAKSTLEVLREPLENREVTISRSLGHFSFPTNFLCIAAMNPCPCGYLGHPDKPCTDSESQILRYRSKISGPLLDRIDMHIQVAPIRYHELESASSQEPSSEIRKRVIAARSIQNNRLGGCRTNSLISSKEFKKYCILEDRSKQIMQQVMEKLHLSARSHDRLIRVARTIADLAESPSIEKDHLMEALSFRDTL